MMTCQEELNEMFTELLLYMYQNLEHFGEILMVDGKAVQSHGTKNSKNKKSGGRGNMMRTGAKNSTVQAAQMGNQSSKPRNGLDSGCI